MAWAQPVRSACLGLYKAVRVTESLVKWGTARPVSSFGLRGSSGEIREERLPGQW